MTLTTSPPHVSSPPDDSFVRNTNAPTLYDTLILERSTSIFFDYLRECSELSQRTSDTGVKSTLLVPTNKAVMALGWKPHQGSPSHRQIAEGGGDVEITEEMGRANVERWISAHVLPTPDIDFEISSDQPTLLADKSIVIHKTRTGEKEEPWRNYAISQNGGYINLTRRIEAENGVLYVIDGAISSD
ncbi:hypothetical protein FRB99_009007 [Tulasnella sp. 403]|nr:hypothetical protein FRB99_009007 [Tulasnella sp. 403]